MGDTLQVKAAVPYVYCADAGCIADWCVRVLGFEERARWSDGDVVRNVELTAGGAEVWLDGPVVDWQSRFDGLSSWVGFWVDDVDAVYRAIREAAPDVKVTAPVERDFGIRMITVTDPEGHQWSFMRRTPNV